MLPALVTEAKLSLRNLMRTATPALLSARIQSKWDHEPEFSLLPALCDPERISIDVGANWGQYAGALRNLSVSVIACEPVPELAKFLSRSWPDRIRVEQVALSNANGRAEFYVENDWSQSRLGSSASSNGSRRVAVELKTLDSIAEGPIGFIKIDVEGHEEEVIEGAERVITENHPVLLAEIEERHRPGAIERLNHKLSAGGYFGFFLQGHCMRPIAEFKIAEYQNPVNYPHTGDSKAGLYINNFVFIHHSSLAEKKKRLAEIGYTVAPGTSSAATMQTP